MCVYVKANMEMTEVLSFHQAAVLSSPPRQNGANQLARYEGHIYILHALPTQHLLKTKVEESPESALKSQKLSCSQQTKRAETSEHP